MHLSPLVAWAVVCSKAVGSVVVDSLFIVVIVVCRGSVFGPCFVILYSISFLVLQ